MRVREGVSCFMRRKLEWKWGTVLVLVLRTEEEERIETNVRSSFACRLDRRAPRIMAPTIPYQTWIVRTTYSTLKHSRHRQSYQCTVG